MLHEFGKCIQAFSVQVKILTAQVELLIYILTNLLVFIFEGNTDRLSRLIGYFDNQCTIRRIFIGNICHHGTGWTTPSASINGFPGVVTWDGEHHTLNLFVAQTHYEPYELDIATAHVVDVSHIDLTAITADILAEG